eukprot:12430001-Prorocentrum_lima.AAC.1
MVGRIGAWVLAQVLRRSASRRRPVSRRRACRPGPQRGRRRKIPRRSKGGLRVLRGPCSANL